ncbi:MAG: DsbA family oxidoreductase [Myxococcota bacterium]
MDRRGFLRLSAVGLVSACSRDGGSPQPVHAVKQVRVEVWHDLICPWCCIGLSNLGNVLSGWRGPQVEVVLHPFLLSPDTPPEGTDLRAHLDAKYGASRSEQMFARVTQAGAQYGVVFNWEKVRVAPLSVPGHALLGFAPMDKQLTLLGAMHHAYFREGQNLGAVEVLASVARVVGLDQDEAVQAALDPERQAEVRRRAAAASAARITGVPHFRIGGPTLQGARSPEDLRAAMTTPA